MPSPKRKPGRELEVVPGRAHRDRDRLAVQADLERQLDGDLVGARRRAPPPSTSRRRRIRMSMVSRPGPSAPRAREPARSPRRRRARSDTATTLYSGHEVFTSADGPISRLVRTSGKWKAVNTWPCSIRSVTRDRQPDHRRGGCAPRPRRRPRSAERRGVGGMDLEPVGAHQLEVAGAARHRAGVVVLEPAAGDEDQRELVVGLVAGRLVRQRREVRLPALALEALLVEDRRVGAVGRDRPLEAAAADALVADAGVARRHLGDLVHHVARASRSPCRGRARARPW